MSPPTSQCTARADARHGLVVGIDASRNRSGGAKTHLLGILTAVDPRQHGVARVHVWSYDTLLRALPDVPWLVKHNPPALEKRLPHQMWWQYRYLSGEVSAQGCDVLLTTDAGSICRFKPSIVMSRDMLSFEGNEMRRYRLASFARMRLWLLRHMQVSSLRRANGALFLTRYASEVIQTFTGPLPTVRIIPHGIGEEFRQNKTNGLWAEPIREVRCVYVSNADMYKHQWHVVAAFARLRAAGHSVSLQLIGGGTGPARALLDEAIARHDPQGHFVKVLDAVPHQDIPRHLATADIFVFASSCENMPNTLVEAMAAGLPIACSNRGPMPEILQGGGAYFDPEDPAAIAAAVEKLLVNRGFRHAAAVHARALASQYSWARCARETWAYLSDVAAQQALQREAPRRSMTA